MFYFNIFWIFAILGYFEEMLIAYFFAQTKRTLLLGPWMPIYGFGILIVEFINQFGNKLKLRGFKKIIFCFIFSTILLTLLELIGGILVELFFHTSFWNYEAIPLSIGPYINILISILWGLGAIIIEYIILPFLTPWIKKIPKWVSYLILILMTIDHLICFSTKLNFMILQ